MPLDLIPAEEKVGIRKVDVRRGAVDGSVSSQWYGRPDDQRYLSLEALYEALTERRDASWIETAEAKRLQVRAYEDQNRLTVITPEGREVKPTHWSFGQMAQAIGAPAGYLRSLPSSLAGINLQYGLTRLPSEIVKFFGTAEDDAAGELRAMTGANYGRVFDAEVVEAIMGTIDDTWKVPGVINWGNSTYDPDAPVSKQSTTLYASDRDVFVFLCRDQYPIEVGTLDDGSPDYLFPGVIVSNSEVGSRALVVETFYLRGTCFNRNLWGTQDKRSLRLIHSSGLPSRFLSEAVPALEEFSKVAASGVQRMVADANGKKVADDDDEAAKFLSEKLGLNRKTAKSAVDLVLSEEGHPMRSLWDAVNGVTALARSISHQDDRVALERKAGALMRVVA